MNTMESSFFGSAYAVLPFQNRKRSFRSNSSKSFHSFILGGFIALTILVKRGILLSRWFAG